MWENKVGKGEGIGKEKLRESLGCFEIKKKKKKERKKWKRNNCFLDKTWWRWHFISVIFHPGTHNPSLIMRKTSGINPTEEHPTSIP